MAGVLLFLIRIFVIRLLRPFCWHFVFIKHCFILLTESFEKTEMKRQITITGGSSYSSSSSKTSTIVTTVLHIILRLIALFIVGVVCYAAFSNRTTLFSWHPSLASIGVSGRTQIILIVFIFLDFVAVVADDERSHFHIFRKFLFDAKFETWRTHGSSWCPPIGRWHLLSDRFYQHLQYKIECKWDALWYLARSLRSDSTHIDDYR